MLQSGGSYLKDSFTGKEDYNVDPMHSSFPRHSNGTCSITNTLTHRGKGDYLLSMIVMYYWTIGKGVVIGSSYKDWRLGRISITINKVMEYRWLWHKSKHKRVPKVRELDNSTAGLTFYLSKVTIIPRLFKIYKNKLCIFNEYFSLLSQSYMKIEQAGKIGRWKLLILMWYTKKFRSSLLKI